MNLNQLLFLISFKQIIKGKIRLTKFIYYLCINDPINVAMSFVFV